MARAAVTELAICVVGALGERGVAAGRQLAQRKARQHAAVEPHQAAEPDVPDAQRVVDDVAVPVV
jgi:hypothetical protein